MSDSTDSALSLLSRLLRTQATFVFVLTALLRHVAYKELHVFNVYYLVTLNTCKYSLFPKPGERTFAPPPKVS